MPVVYNPKYPIPVSDTTLYDSPNLLQTLVNDGWHIHKSMVNTRDRGMIPSPYTVLERTILNPILERDFSRNGQIGKIGNFPPDSETPYLCGSEGIETVGAKQTMGVAISNFAPAPADASQNTALDKFSSIRTLRLMRSDNDSFNVGFDSEFYYDEENHRHILSWQFAFVDPADPDNVVELLVFANTKKLLTLSFILNFIVEEWNIGVKMGLWESSDGFSYHKARRWVVPVLRNGHLVKSKPFDDFDIAVQTCQDEAFKEEMIKHGPRFKQKLSNVDNGNGNYTITPEVVINGFGLGYDIDYKEANKHALPVTVVCSTGSADLTTINVDDKYEKDLMTKVRSVQGGLVTLMGEIYLHNPQLSKYWNMYPLKVSVRDTNCLAPAKKKSVEELGKSIKVPKVMLPEGYSKDDMLHFLSDDIVDYGEYASTDSLITLLYSSELLGYNKELPLTITSAGVKAAKPVLKEYFGLTPDDDAGFDMIFRGVHRVKKGKYERKGSRGGYIDDTNLEPISDDAARIQNTSGNSYKGGINACFRPGYFEKLTHDYDLENAYLTGMSLTPDLDYLHPFITEIRNQPLTPMMIRSPFDPVFGYVTFKFPESVKVPCIPVSVEGSLIYPRTNGELTGYKDGVYVAAPELWLALKLGAEVFVKSLYIGNIKTDEFGNPSHSLLEVVRQFVKDRKEAQKIFGKKSLPDLLCKEGGNGIYGKLAQDVIDKHAWDSQKETMENIGGSVVTSPYHASMITSGVRAMVIAAINQSEEMGYEAYSVTTDGFITDAPFDVLCNMDLYGLSNYFKKARMLITGLENVWSEKHKQYDLLNLTTRGNVSERIGNESLPEDHPDYLPGVCAHNSFVTEASGTYGSDSYEDRHEFMYKSMTRTGPLYTLGKSFASFRDLSKRTNRRDFFVRDQERWISMDFDMKRKPIRSTMKDEYKYFDEEDEWGVVATFDTEPFDSPEEYLQYKKVARSIVANRNGSLKTLRTVADWDQFFDKIAGKQDGVRRNITDLEWSKLFSCVMAYRLGKPLDFLDGECADIPCLDDASPWSREQKVEWINGFNKSGKKVFTINTWKDCRKTARMSQMLTEDLFKDLLTEMMEQSPTLEELNS